MKIGDKLYLFEDIVVEMSGIPLLKGVYTIQYIFRYGYHVHIDIFNSERDTPGELRSIKTNEIQFFYTLQDLRKSKLKRIL